MTGGLIRTTASTAPIATKNQRGNQMTQSSAEQIKADEAEVRSVVAAWSRAVEAKDADALVARYQADTVLFDAIPPFRTVGKDAIRQIWKNVLPHFPEQFRSEHRD